MLLTQILETLGLSEGPKRVLVVEDQVAFALGLTKFLRALGHQVQVVSGVAKLDGMILTGIPLEGSGISPWPEIDLQEIDVAFFDHYFATTNRFSQSWDGYLLSKEVCRCDWIKVMGISSVGRANQAMTRAGAIFGMTKQEFANLLGL